MGTVSQQLERMARSLLLSLAFMAALALTQSRQIKQKETIDIEWIIPFEPYELCIAPGTEISFNWTSENHNVDLVGSQLEWDECDNISNTEPTTGPFLWKSPDTEGTFYIVCRLRDSNLPLQHE